MTDKTRKALEMALAALQHAVMSAGGETGCDHDPEFNICFCQENAAIAAITEALAEPAPRRLTDAEILNIAVKSPLSETYWFSPKFDGYEDDVQEVTAFARDLEAQIFGDNK